MKHFAAKGMANCDMVTPHVKPMPHHLCALASLVLLCCGCPLAFPHSPMCETDAECDDGLFCTGVETCVLGTCEPGADPCPEDECDETRNACVDCLSDAQCGEWYMCLDGQCEWRDFIPPECDDGYPCTIEEFAGPGICVHTDLPCGDGFVCDSDTGECVPDTMLGD